MGAGDALIPLAENLCSSIATGQCLAALLVHYIPQAAKWSGEFHGQYTATTEALQ